MNNFPKTGYLIMPEVHRIDQTDVPDGYKAVPKSELKYGRGDNICNYCDWRKDCDSRICKCGSHSRKDKVGVFFKKI